MSQASFVKVAKTQLEPGVPRARGPREGRSIHNGALRAFVFALLLLMAVPAAAGASTVSVEPFREPPGTDPFGSCGRYMSCPADMVVLTAASGETNHVAITEAVVGLGQTRYLVRDKRAPVVAGAGCEHVDDNAAVCTAGAVGPQQLGDGDDWITSPGGQALGGDGDDVLTLGFHGTNPAFYASLSIVDGGEGDDVLSGEEGHGGNGNDVLSGQLGAGGNGDDLLIVGSGRGHLGDDILRCFPQLSGCYLNGGSGNDTLTGDTGSNRLFGEGGHDLLDGRARDDELDGGVGNDRLIGGAGPDMLEGGAGADRLQAREDRSAGEQPKKDRVDCGTGRRDRATVNRRDRVTRCERVTRRQERAG
jgi:Ca2+-binding RTX toxin-like protein